jgi:hypothetical protein
MHIHAILFTHRERVTRKNRSTVMVILAALAGLSCIAFTMQALAADESVPPKSLKDVTFDLQKLEKGGSHTYTWTAIVLKGESKECGKMVVSTQSEKDDIVLHDTITVVPAFGGMAFDRMMRCPKGDLLRPQQITLDISKGDRTVREMSYENGTATILDDPNGRGPARTEQWNFQEGILTFNALLRLAPLLPRNIGGVYTFKQYAEPVLFDIWAVQAGTITCEGTERLIIGKKFYDCVRYKESFPGIRSDVWVSDNIVVRVTFWHGAEYVHMEANLQE